VIIKAKRLADFVLLRRCARALAAVCFAALSGCVAPSEPAESTHTFKSALRLDIDDSDSGMEDALCGNRTLDPLEQCDPSVDGWKYFCDEHCKRLAYKPCDSSVDDCGGNNALCASYAAQPDTQFCADFCMSDANCPMLPGFAAACNLAWCAVLCSDDRQCPQGMSCLNGATFLDFEGNSRGERNVCVVTSTLPPPDGF
jgi:hypothetical protein